MSAPVIICVDDQREVLEALAKDLEFLEELFDLIECESAQEAGEILDEMHTTGKTVSLLISDHVMPGKSGVDFLSEVSLDSRFEHSKKILLTGLATHEDTIRAINQAHIDLYVGKPWDKAGLVQDIRRLLTLFFLESGLEYQPFLKVLDSETLYKGLHQKGN